MFERDSVMAAAAEVLDGLGAGRGRALFVVGEAGLGKSSVLAAVRDLAGPGVRAGVGRGDPMEMLLPFGLLAQAVDALGGRDVLKLAPGEQDGDVRAARFYGLQRWLEALSPARVVMVLDDLHWTDPDSLALLSFLCRRIASLPVGVIAALRPWPVEALQVASELAEGGYARVVRLAPLSEAAGAALLAARIGSELVEAVSSRAWALCAGNPLLLEQLATAVRRGDDLSALAAGSAGSDLLLLSRFSGLPATVMSLARGASVFGVSFRPEAAAAVAGLCDPDAGMALDAMWRSGLFQTDGATAMRFVHPLFRQALYEDLGPALRARLHAAAFSVLLAAGCDTEAAEHAIWGHLVGDASAVAVLETVGRAAQRSGALAAAAAYLRAAVDLAGSRAGPGLRLALATVVLAVGPVAEAIGLAEALVADRSTPPAERLGGLRLLGRALTVAGAPEQAAASFEQAVAAAESEGPTAAVEVLLDYAMASWTTAGPAKSLPLMVRARRLAAGVERPLRLRAEVAWGQVALQAGDASGAQCLAVAPELEAALLAPAGVEVSGAWGALENLAFALILAERFDDADRVFRSARHVAERVGPVEAMATLANVHAYCLMRTGRLAEAAESMAVVGSLGELHPMMALYAPVGWACIAQHLGRLDEADSYYQHAAAGILRSGFFNARLFLWDMRGHRHLLEGRPAQACEYYVRLEDLARRMGVTNPGLPPWAGHAIAAHLACGDDAQAARLVTWLEDQAERRLGRWPAMVAAGGRAALAERAGDHAGAHDHHRAALGLLDGMGLPLDRIEALTAYGGFLRRAGQVTQARAALAQAVEVAEVTGAAWLGGYAARELAVAGGRRRSTRSRQGLTPAEHRVAELAAAGSTNAAIAAQLVISEATVESHLAHVYAKLGIHSRRQLPAPTTPTDTASEQPDR